MGGTRGALVGGVTGACFGSGAGALVGEATEFVWKDTVPPLEVAWHPVIMLHSIWHFM